MGEQSETFEAAKVAAWPMLSPPMKTATVLVLLAAIALQESRLIYRRQKNNGPARGLWQFELGTEESRGGVYGIYLHAASRNYLRLACIDLGVAFNPYAIWDALETNDTLAFVCARLLLWTDPAPLPGVDDVSGSWDAYLRIWRPGSPRKRTWRSLHDQAVVMVTT